MTDDAGELPVQSGVLCQFLFNPIAAMEDGSMVAIAQFAADLGERAGGVFTEEIHGRMACKSRPPIPFLADEVLDRDVEGVCDGMDDCLGVA